ncbi:hypothetical protein AGMMS50276_32770 [Synergistales bacterium]|nr:hypothetical protein AGMMS50276_32770 [Synergistales bacterium]
MAAQCSQFYCAAILPGIPLSQGTFTWHLPQPNRGLCFSLVLSTKSEQR